jgi:hypothetical protein
MALPGACQRESLAALAAPVAVAALSDLSNIVRDLAHGRGRVLWWRAVTGG